MSLLTVGWDDTVLALGCRPDPVREPVRLDLELPRLLHGMPGGEGGELLRRLLHEFGTQVHETGDSSLEPRLLDVFRRTLETIHASPEAGVLLLGGVSHVCLLVPAGVRESRRQRLHDLLAPATEALTTLPRVSAAVAGAGKELDPQRTVLRIHWGEDLVTETLKAHGRPEDLLRVFPGRTLRDVGRQARIRRLAAELVRASAVPSDRARRMAEEYVTTGTTTDPAAAGITMDHEARRAWSPIVHRVETFVAEMAGNARDGGASEAVIDGLDDGVPGGRAAVERALVGAGFARPSASGTDPAILGAFRLVKQRPVLPYDCGVLLRPKGDADGIGTLVLVYPARVGAERETEPFVLGAKPGQSFEVAIYTRRIDPVTGALVMEVMKSHVFVPKLDIRHETRITARIRVEESESGGASVTIVVRDHHAREDAVFERLPLVAESILKRPPLHSAEELAALEWRDRVNEVLARASSSLVEGSVADWRKAFERQVATISRKDCAQIIMRHVLGSLNAVEAASGKPFDEIAKGVPGALQKDEFVEKSAPAEFVVIAREALFGALRSAVRETAARGGRHCQGWLRTHSGSNAGSPQEDAVRQGVLALTQDLARNPEWESVTRAVAEIPGVYHHFCSPPQSLNIAW